MSLYNGPSRGGNRGGKDQFNWDDVKNAGDREFYLGHSVKASTGRWQKGKDILWYTREKKGDQEQQLADELAAIKEREEDLMAEAMGMKPKVRVVPKAAPTGQELELLMRKARGEGGEAEDGPPPEAPPDAMPGLGFSKGDDVMDSKPMGASHEVMAGTGVLPPAGATSAQQGEEARLTKAELAILETAEKAAAKRSKKAGKKAKKLAKAVRKEDRHRVKAERRAAHTSAQQPLPPPPPQQQHARAQHRQGQQQAGGSHDRERDGFRPEERSRRHWERSQHDQSTARLAGDAHRTDHHDRQAGNDSRNAGAGGRDDRHARRNHRQPSNEGRNADGGPREDTRRGTDRSAANGDRRHERRSDDSRHRRHSPADVADRRLSPKREVDEPVRQREHGRPRDDSPTRDSELHRGQRPQKRQRHDSDSD